MDSFHSLLNAIEYIRQYLEHQLDDQTPTPPGSLTISDDSALARLCRILNLNDFERDILILCAAMEIEPTFPQLCGKLHGSTQLNYPTLGLALTTFPHGSRSVLSPQSPLQSWQLIEFGTGVILTQNPICIDKRILCYLLGEVAIDERLLGYVTFLPADLEHITLAPSQEKLVLQVVTYLSSLSSPSNLWQLCGEDLTAKYALANAVGQQLGYNLLVMSAGVLPANPKELFQLKQCWEREALLTDSILFLECDELLTQEPRQAWQVDQFVKNLQTPVIISSRERLHTSHNHLISFDVPQLSHSEQAGIWATHLGTEATQQLNGHIAKLVSQFNLSNATIQAACQQFKIPNAKFPQNTASSPPSPPILGGTGFQSPPAPLTPQSWGESADASLFDRSDLGGKNLRDADQDELGGISSLWDFCRTQARPRLDGLAQRLEPVATWDDLVLLEQPRQMLQDIATHLRQRAKVYQEWGFSGKGSRGLGISALFHGESGTGKTMAAEVLANEFRLDLYRIDLSAVVSKYIGETEKNLRRIFEAAETGGAILLFDEADALFGKRTEVKDSHDRHANVEVSYLLQRMEAYQGLAILTTNMKSALDQAFLRRIRFIVDFPFPTWQERKLIRMKIFPAATPTEGLDGRLLAQLNMSGGSIRNIALNAAFYAADAGEPVMMKHILQATRRECKKQGKLLGSNELKGWEIESK